MSVIAAFASFSSLATFVALGFVGNGVITVMINVSPRQADIDTDNQSGDNRGDSAHTSISLTVPPASLNFTVRLSALSRTGGLSARPAVKPRYLRRNGRLPDGYHHDQS